jgi:hypothetical protein
VAELLHIDGFALEYEVERAGRRCIK